MESKAVAHALLLPLPFQGHINPLLELSKKLVSAGFMVTFANTQVNHQRISRFLAQRRNGEDSLCGDGDLFLSKKELGILPPEVDVEEPREEGGRYIEQESRRFEGKDGGCFRLVSLEEGLPAEFGHFANQLQASISAPMRASVERLVERLLGEECPVSCLVSDFRILFVQDIANKYGLPRLGFWTQSAASFISNLLLARGFQAPPDDSTLITSMPGVPPHKRSEVSGLMFDGVQYPRLSDEYLWQPFLQIGEAKWVMINTFEQLELTTLQALQEMLGFRLLTVGPLVGVPAFSILEGISGSTVGDDECAQIEDSPYMKWLRDHPPASVLYIAFGTVATMSMEQLEELVFGLKATRQPFFWVFRPDLCKSLDDLKWATLFQHLENQGIVVPWVLQCHILRHPAVGGFLTHCGWNSTLEGISAGVPMLGWPHLGDQFVNQRCIEQWGNGLHLVADKKLGGLVTRAEVEEKVLALMQGPTAMHLKQKALALQTAAHDALAGGSSSLNIEHFLRGLCRTS